MAIQRTVLDCFAALAMTIALLFAVPATAQTFPANNGSPVVDQAGILRPEQVLDLKSKAEALYAQSGRAFAVATVNSLEGYPVEDYAYRLGRAWKLGSAKEDDGVLLLVAPNERKVAIATGYGAGEYMTDAMSGIIIRDAILPHFKQNPPDYGGGIEAGADRIVSQMSLPPEEAQKNVAAAEQSQRKHQDFWTRLHGRHLLDGHHIVRHQLDVPRIARPPLSRPSRRHQPMGRAVGLE